jgi:uncharacterized protein YkwD
MPVSFPCPTCRSVVKISSKIPYKTPVKCPNCAGVFPNPAKPGKYRVRSADDGYSSSRGVRASAGLKVKRMLLFGAFVGLLMVAGAAGYLLINKYDFFGGGVAQGTDGKTGTSAGTGGGGTADGGGINKGSGAEDPLAYVPPDANSLVGFNATAANAQPALKSLLDLKLTELGLVKTLADSKGQTGLEFKELFDTTVIAAKLNAAGKPETQTLILKSSVPFDQKKLGQWASAGAPQKLKDKFYFEKHKDIPLVQTTYMPSDRVLVLTDVPAAKWEGLFATDGSKPSAAAGLVPLVRKVEKSPYWWVQSLDGGVREAVAGGKGPPEAAVFGVGDAQAVFKKALADAKGLAQWVTVEGDKLTLGVALGCGSDAAATELVAALDASWGKIKEAKAKEAEGSPKELQGLLKDGFGSLKFSKQETTASATMTLAGGAAAELVKAGPAALQKTSADLFVMAGKPAPMVVEEKPFAPSAEEMQLLQLINQARAQSEKKNAPLKPSPKLFEIARAYAALLAKEGKEDDELDGKNYLKRLADAGYKVKRIGEDDWACVNMTSGENLPAPNAYSTWIQNAAAKEFLLDKYEETGIGIAKSDKNIVFYYMIYAIPAN